MTELRKRVKDILWRHWFDGPHDTVVAETVVDELFKELGLTATAVQRLAVSEDPMVEAEPYGRCDYCGSVLCGWDGSCHFCDDRRIP